MKHIQLLCVLALGSAAMAADPVLIGHWKLDEKEGDVAADSSPLKNNAKIVNGPARTSGKFGGALAFDGKNQYVEIPTSKELDSVQDGSFSICAWVKAENVPPGTESANDAQYAILCKTGWHTGLTYTSDKKFVFSYWLKGETDPVWTGTGAWDQDYEPGEWHHVVAVVNRETRKATVYLDSEEKGSTEEWDAKAEPKKYDSMSWKIGAAAPGAANWAWHAKAAISDVRIYQGALSPEKVKAIFDGKE